MSKDSGLDLIAVLVRNHREIERMLGELERLPQSAGRRRQDAAAALARELTWHRETEVECLYAVVRKYLPDGADLVERDRRAWSDAAALLDGLSEADTPCGRLDELIELLASWIRRHVADQEEELLAELGKHADRSELEWLGDRVHAVKQACVNASGGPGVSETRSPWERSAG